MNRLVPALALAALAGSISGLWAPAARASDLVGPASCRSCHAEAYRVWSASAHARATASLTGEQRKQPLCLQCHSRDEAKSGQAEVTGVSCETCHGGGRWYQASVVMRDMELAHAFGLADPSPSSCKVCHGGETPSLRKFDVKEAMARIDHWSADRAARKKPPQPQDKKASQEMQPQAPRTQLAAWLRGRG